MAVTVETTNNSDSNSNSSTTPTTTTSPTKEPPMMSKAATMATATSASNATMTSSSSGRSYNLSARYFARLGLDPAQLDVEPTIEKLRIIQEAHLATIPFENLSQHGCAHPAVLDVEATAIKVLDNQRGGFCHELNGLLAEFLMELGYKVCRFVSYVWIAEVGVYMDVAAHMILAVTCEPAAQDDDDKGKERLESIDSSSSKTWLVDVGFGEPAIHPLSYDVATVWDQVQVTPEGMRSKLVRSGSSGNAESEEYVELFMYKAESDTWVPRLKWKYADALLQNENGGQPNEVFALGLETVLDEGSVFGQKLIVCLLTRTEKRTLAGHRLKVTTGPRFPVSSSPEAEAAQSTTKSSGSNDESNDVSSSPIQAIYEIESEDEAQDILWRDFGIPKHQSDGLALTKSRAAHPMIWALK